jgi:WD40 repeat protein
MVEVAPLAWLVMLMVGFWVFGLNQEVSAEERREANGGGSGSTTAKRVSFLRDIAPILVRRCVACHNGEKAQGSVALHTWEALQRGQDGEPLLKPGKPEFSLLYEVLEPDYEPRMPYKEPPLAEEQRRLIAEWIREGASYDGPSASIPLSILVASEDLYRTPPEAYPAPFPVTALAFSSDGAWLASGGYHEILIWEVSSGKLLRRLQGAPERVYGLAFSPNGWWLASAGGVPGRAGSVQLWDAKSGEPIKEILRSEDSLYALAFSPDSRYLAAGGCDRTVHVWDLATGHKKYTVDDHADWVLALCFSPNGKFLASASRDKTAKLFDAASGESVAVFPHHGEAVYAVAFTDDSQLVATAGADRKIRIWTADREAKEVRLIDAHEGPIFALRLQGGRWWSCSADRTVRAFDLRDGKQVAILKGHNDWVYALAAHLRHDLVASGSWDGQIYLWDAASGSLVRNFLACPTSENAANATIVRLEAVLRVANSRGSQ